ncbi:MAG: nuclear transport factor 2 family protein [Roseovarius sp.]
MTDVRESGDCGNSPKNRFAQSIAIAIEKGELSADAFSDDVTWHGTAAAPLEGIDAVRRFLQKSRQPAGITVHHAISHGKVAAVSGEVTPSAGAAPRRFCHVFVFTSAKGTCIRSIQSYA